MAGTRKVTKHGSENGKGVHAPIERVLSSIQNLHLIKGLCINLLAAHLLVAGAKKDGRFVGKHDPNSLIPFHLVLFSRIEGSNIRQMRKELAHY